MRQVEIRVPLRIWVETLRTERLLLGSLEGLAPRIVQADDRARIYEIRQELLEIIKRDLNLKRKLLLPKEEEVSSKV